MPLTKKKKTGSLRTKTARHSHHIVGHAVTEHREDVELGGGRSVRRPQQTDELAETTVGTETTQQRPQVRQQTASVTQAWRYTQHIAHNQYSGNQRRLGDETDAVTKLLRLTFYIRATILFSVEKLMQEVNAVFSEAQN